MTLFPSVDTLPEQRVEWRSAFPTPEMVEGALALLPRLPVVIERAEVASPWRCALPDQLCDHRACAPVEVSRNDLEEGPRWYLGISSGTVSVRSQDARRRELAEDRGRVADAGSLLSRRSAMREERAERSTRYGRIKSWSAKSRANMVRVLQEADWSLVLADGPPTAVTLTYPGDWRAVAPDGRESWRHVRLLLSRWSRRWGGRPAGAWKKEFQRRGAPHYHLLVNAPRDAAFRSWLASEWAKIVGAASCSNSLEECQSTWLDGGGCEFHRHLVAGTSVDHVLGARMRDPRRIGVYFSKHGSFASKDYQNEAPPEWVESGSVGRFWGTWQLPSTRREVEVKPWTALLAARTLRRHSRANAYVARVPQWRYRTVVDESTGVVSARWRKSSKLARVYRMRYGAGFVAVNDGANLGAQLGRYLSELSGEQRSGSGPVGFLP